MIIVFEIHTKMLQELQRTILLTRTFLYLPQICLKNSCNAMKYFTSFLFRNKNTIQTLYVSVLKIQNKKLDKYTGEVSGILMDTKPITQLAV